jgi:prepilin-type N-terminal cleavage/methylation domain-containing protein
MISLKRKQSGFTIVELLIVIVVIGILAAIVITTFTGVQKKARDSDRKADIQAIYSQTEVYFAQNSKYPTLANINDGAFRSANMKGLQDDAITAPGGTVGLVASGAAITNYQYVATPSGCDNSATDCTGFTLTATLESGGTFVKTGSNN